MKIKLLLLLLAIGIASTSCGIKEEAFSPSFDGDVVFYATNGDGQVSKTALQNDGSIKWKPQDRISVFYGTSAFEFSSTNTEDSSEVEFHGTLDGIEYTNDGEFWAVYPYRESNSFDGLNVTVTLPDEQTAVAGSFDDDLFISIAKTKDYNLQFYNVCGGVRFSVAQDGVQYVIFKGNNDEQLAGTAKATFNSNGIPYIKEIISGLSEIKVSAPEHTTFEKGKWYYIVCFPIALQSGYSLLLVNQDGTAAKKKNNTTVTIKRSIWGSLEETDKYLSYEIPHDEIWYTTTDGQVLYPTRTNNWGRKIVSNTYTDGKGVLKFDGPITEIPYYAYYYNSLSGGYLKTISIPNCVTSISSYAFYQCNNLESIQMPSELTTISAYAFYRCGKLKNLVIPEKVSSIGVNVFTDCYSMDELTILSTSKNFGDDRGYGYVINNASYISHFSGPNASEDGRFIIIDNCLALAAGKDLESVTIPNDITDLGPYAFSKCQQLRSVTLPNSVTKVSEGCFSYCSSLEGILLPSSLTHIGYDAFYKCVALKSVDIPNGVETIQGFRECSSLGSVTMPGAVTISGNAFQNCQSLNSVQFGDKVTHIYSLAFDGCESLTHFTIPSNLVYLATDALTNCPITSLEVLCSATAFDTSFGSKSRYASCIPRSKLTEITGPFARENNSMLIIDGVLLLATIQNRESAIIPEDVITVSESVFNNSASLKTVVIPSNVTKIDIQAFRNCTSLEKVVVRAITPPSITTSSFYNVGNGLNNGSTYPFYVPKQSLNTYKNTDIWSDYSDRIYGDVDESDFVDLGLSVKWSQFNIGASTPEGFGDFYSWGETKPKSSYSWTSYLWCNGTRESLNKYNTNSDWGAVDNKEALESEDDVAYFEVGNGCQRMPSHEEWDELIQQCMWTWISINGVNGFKVISKKNGYTEKWIFLPVAGRKYDNETWDESQGNYWSRSLYTNLPLGAWGIDFNNTPYISSVWDYKNIGRLIRPVYND